jgi:hypothetical protein
MQMFIIALSKITWKQPKCPGCIHALKYYSTIKQNVLLNHNNTFKHLGVHYYMTEAA